MSWSRPDSIPYPTVWHRFEGKVLIDGKPLQYRVQDVTEDLFEPVIQTLVRYYLVRELCFSHDGIVEDEVSLNELKEKWRKALKQRVSLVVIVEGDGDEAKRIAGCNILMTVQRSDPKPPEIKGRAMKKAFQKWQALYEKENLYEKYGVDKYAYGYGLTVTAQYQGDNVGYNILKARTPLLEASKIPLVLTSFTNPVIIQEAIKYGYDIIQNIKAEDFIIDGKKHYQRLNAQKITLAALVLPNSNKV